jgi:hypothetical protein
MNASMILSQSQSLENSACGAVRYHGRRGSSSAPLSQCRQPATGAAWALIMAFAFLIAGSAGLSRADDASPQIVHAVLIKEKIEAIVHPKFVDAKGAVSLQPLDRVIGVVIGKVAKAYPVRILRWHQVVNDVIDGKPIAVTYCPLTGNAAVY